MSILLSTMEKRFSEISMALKKEGVTVGSGDGLYVICRRGNDSQRAVQLLHKMGFSAAKDIIGGLESWARDVDLNFPCY
ncbi:hypothetical protein RJ639_019152 [Escallonia herrerae]|nr:hypothetical protein RJ639_019152 [Escallonia herrerae]